MAKISLPDFFKYFDPNNVNQLEAIVLLESMMPETLLRDRSAWVELYRKPLPKPEAPPWPITKEQLGYIMQCSSETLNDALINDLARCVADCEMDPIELVFFLGQCGHESAGLRYPVEIHDGSNYEGRTDLGNTQPGDGVKFAGTGWIQVTGRYNHQSFADAIGDPKVMELGKTYTSEKYPWSISAFWWKQNNMKALCQQHKACNDADIDAIGARVNGRMRPNGADDRISFTDRAYRTLIGV
jgi:predicted chitinase